MAVEAETEVFDLVLRGLTCLGIEDVRACCR